ncbi:MAG TPA: hypothetical protein VFB74_14565 [Kribbellaceae bacterium]|nr:hypothetical protein [Kribbellaceae bacterium]
MSRLALDQDEHVEVARRALNRRLPELVRKVVEHDTDDELREALRLAVARFRPAHGAISALDELPVNTPFVELAIEVLLTAAVALEAVVTDDPDRCLPDLARTHNNLCVALQMQGERDEAAAAGRRAVSTYRSLVERNGDAHLPGLASALNNLQIALTDLGRVS